MRTLYKVFKAAAPWLLIVVIIASMGYHLYGWYQFRASTNRAVQFIEVYLRNDNPRLFERMTKPQPAQAATPLPEKTEVDK